MASSRLSLFCTTRELTGIIKLLASKYLLDVVIFTRSEDVGYRYNPTDFTALPANCFYVYLCPAKVKSKSKLQFEHIKSTWGWIEIEPGGDRDHPGILILTECHVDDVSQKEQSLVKCLQWLKRDFIKKNAVYGVYGRKPVQQNTLVMDRDFKHETMRYYRDIAYTKGAAEALKQGCLWKQYPSGTSVFIPKPDE